MSLTFFIYLKSFQNVTLSVYKNKNKMKTIFLKIVAFVDFISLTGFREKTKAAESNSQADESKTMLSGDLTLKNKQHNVRCYINFNW